MHASPKQPSNYNLVNIITFMRIPALFVITTLVTCNFQGALTVAFTLFLIAGCSDWLDGYLARKLNLVSNLGKFMDALTDKVLVTGMLISLLQAGILPSWGLNSVLLIVCREFLVTGLRLVAAGKGHILAAEAIGKLKAVLQLLSIGALLFSSMLYADWESACHPLFLWVMHYFGYATFIAATVLTVVSGYQYLRKYWHILL